MAERDLKIVSCPGAQQFAEKLAKHLKRRNPRTRLVSAEFPTFKNGEVKTVLKEPIRGSDVFVIQDVANTKTGTVNDNLMTLFTAVDACNHASCDEINVIVPTFPYARQHKKAQREGLTAALLCHFFESMNIRRIITLDIHNREIQNSFTRTVVENLHASYPLIKTLVSNNVSFNDMVVVAPDVGSIARNTFFASVLKLPLAMMYKERDYSRVTRDASDTNITTSKLIGEIDHGDILLVDDMIDSGGSWLTAARELKSLGARDVYGVVSLPFFNDPAIESFQRAYDEGVFKLIVGTNAVYNPRLWKQRWFLRADVTDLFAEIIFRINADVSVSDFLDGGEAINELLRGSDEE